MRVFILGATGYIGNAVAAAIQRRGHEVLGLARSDEARKRLEAQGHTALQGDMRDAAQMATIAAGADAVVHAANTNSGENPGADAALTRAILGALAGSGRTFVYTSGVWGLGHTGERYADESTRGTALPLVAWRDPVQQAVLDAAAEGVRGVVVSPAIVYGHGGGIPAMFVDEARRTGKVRVVEGGRQEWTTVHVEDLAELYALALDAEPGSLLFGAAGPAYRVRDMALAASVGAGAGGALVDWPLAEARAALGGFADALALHQRVSGAKAQRELGWAPSRPSVLEELLTGSYARKA